VAAVGVWQASDTYGHCFLILPMAAYLAWDRRAALAGLAPRPLPALAPLALPLAAAWFLAERLGVMEGRQLAALAALELLVLVVLGWRLFRALRAPLLFLVFLVPFGAFVTPALQQFTAGFIVRGLNVLGVANYATDLTIEISAGVFYVAEACAGLRFLIAAVAFGVFYALLNYQSPGRRLLFVAASVVVPVVANGVRALGIVMLGAILGSANAAAADHVIYGWVFFSVVMLLLVAGGMPFREDPADPAPSGLPAAAHAETRPVWAAAAVVLPLAAGPAASMLLARQVTPTLFTEALAFTTPPGCTADPAPAPAMPAQRITTTLSCAGQPLVVTVDWWIVSSSLVGGWFGWVIWSYVDGSWTVVVGC
jgi:exosortase A